MKASTQVDFGNKIATISVTDKTEWHKDGVSRIYFELEQSTTVITKLYQVIEGTTRDEKIEIAGKTFAYVPGFCNSHKKKAACLDAVKSLAAQLV